MKLAITICATERYTYALGMQANAVVNAVKEFCRRREEDIEWRVIMVGSDKGKAHKVSLFYANQKNCSVSLVKVADDDKNKNYKTKAQLLIAKLRTIAFNEAKKWGATHCWSLDSDVIPKANSLSCMMDTLGFDDGYYEVVSCVYPSQGGGLFLCGRGTQRRQILEDIYPDEKEVPEKAKERMESLDKKAEEIAKTLESQKEKFDEKLLKEINIINKKRRYWSRYVEKKCPPKSSNVFELNSKKWRRRGWFDFAYPAIGKGAIVPSDWMGFGCALISEKALNLIDFSGYAGAGTEDLYIIWNRWYPNGVKIAALPHCPADHIIRARDKSEKLWHIFTFHEADGEFVGHLRQDRREFIEIDV